MGPATVPVVNPSTERSSLTKESGSPTPTEVSSPWPTQALTPTAVNSSSATGPPPTSTESTLSTVVLFPASRSAIRQNRERWESQINPFPPSRSSTVANSRATISSQRRLLITSQTTAS